MANKISAGLRYLAEGRLYFPADAIVYPLGGDGIIYMTNLHTVGERSAYGHIVLWGEDVMGRKNGWKIISAIKTAIKENSLDRVFGEVAVHNRTAIALAKRIGFREIGILRRRPLMGGGKSDSWFADLLPDEIREVTQ